MLDLRVSDIAQMQHISILALCMLHWVYTRQFYVTCFVNSFADIWRTKIGNQILFFGKFPNVLCICEACPLYSPRFANTKMFYY